MRAHILVRVLTQGRGIYVDMTAGNGNDSLVMAKLLQHDGHLYAFDVQQEALDNTLALLTENNIDEKSYSLRLDSHENIDQYIKMPITAAMYNLGYLPNGDKALTTRSDSTVASLKKVLPRLKNGGIITIIAYPGHDGGEEYYAVDNYLSGLPAREYEISRTEMLGKMFSPVLYLIIKR
jgi:predicted O-methyltransferase YrrM